MKVIYHSNGNGYPSIIAAAIHTGKLDPLEPPEAEQVEQLPYFDGLSTRDYGKVIYYGSDSSGNQIYTLCSDHGEEVFQAVTTGYGMSLADVNDLVFIDCEEQSNPLIRVGTVLNKSGLSSLGHPIVLKGCNQAFSGLAALVKETQKTISN